MGREYTDASIADLLVTVTDSTGRTASMEFGDDGITLHRRRPRQGKKAEISYDQLFDCVAAYNAKFFRASKPRKKIR